MRRTITLDKDVAEKLQAEMRRRRSTNFKETVNDVLRRGLMVRRDLAASKPLGYDCCYFSDSKRCVMALGFVLIRRKAVTVCHEKQNRSESCSSNQILATPCSVASRLYA